MSKEMTWQEKMYLDNEALDKIESGVGDETNTVEDSPTDKTPVETETNEPTNTESLPDLDSLLPKTEAQPPKVTEDLTGLQQQIADLRAELQRNKSENGRAHALSERLKQIEAENKELRDRLNEANRVKPMEGRVDEFTQEEQDLISEEMRTVLGGRFASLQKQNEAFAEEQRKIKEQLERANRLAEESERQAMRKLLSTQFPNLSAIANSDAWKKFCAETDPITRQTYGTLFTNSYQRCDTDAVSAIIRHFVSVSGMTDGHKTVGSKPEEHFSRNGGATNPTPKATYKLSEVNAFLTAMYSGRVDMRNERNARLYHEFSAALNEGRVEAD